MKVVIINPRGVQGGAAASGLHCGISGCSADSGMPVRFANTSQ